MKNVAIKIMVFVCFVGVAFAADPRPEVRNYNSEKTAQLQTLFAQADSFNWQRVSVEMMQLIREGANPDTRRRDHDYSSPLLSIACLYKDFELARCLLQHGANPNLSCGKETPLHDAKHVDEAKLLVDYSADPLCIDSEGGNLLHNVVRHGYSAELVPYYVELGVNPNARDRYSYTPLEKCLTVKLDDDYKKKCLYLSDDKEAEKSIKFLLLAKADINKKNSYYGESFMQVLHYSLFDRFNNPKPCKSPVPARIIAFHAALPKMWAAGMLMEHLPMSLAQLIVEYAGPVPPSIEAALDLD